jgi:4-hydroxy-tetrahydrodipicolinate reductase
MSTRVMVLGAAGRMGRMVTAAVQADAALEAVIGFDPAGGVGEGGLELVADLDSALAARPEVAIDFTIAPAARINLPKLIEAGIAPVIGTTGLSGDELAALDAQAKATGVPAFLAPNFAIGAVLMMRFAAEAAKHFQYADILEYHHENKRDAPSGTAMKTLRDMLAARGESFSDTPVDELEELSGARGGSDGFAHVHSIRMPGFVADQDVLLGGPGETLRISHRSIDRSCFMPGVVLAAKRVRGLAPGLTIGLDSLLG